MFIFFVFFIFFITIGTFSSSSWYCLMLTIWRQQSCQVPPPLKEKRIMVNHCDAFVNLIDVGDIENVYFQPANTDYGASFWYSNFGEYCIIDTVLQTFLEWALEYHDPFCFLVRHQVKIWSAFSLHLAIICIVIFVDNKWDWRKLWSLKIQIQKVKKKIKLRHFLKMELYNALRWLQWLPSKIAKLWSLKRKSNTVLYVPTDIAAFSAQTPAAAWRDETIQLCTLYRQILII